MVRAFVRLAVGSALVLAQVVGMPPAPAVVDVGSDLHGIYDGCIAKFTAAGLRDLVDQLDRSRNKFVIRRATATITEPDDKYDAADGTGTGGTTKWFPEDKAPFRDGVVPDTCATLYHEMSHLADYDAGTNRRDTCKYSEGGTKKNSGILVNEVKATRKENAYRATQHLDLRKGYAEGTTLPPAGTECDPAPPAPPRPSGGCSVGCAVGAGDPHVQTFDGANYDLQAVGEFVLVRAANGEPPLEVQGRMSAVQGLRTVSFFSAAAADVAGDHVNVVRAPVGLELHVNGVASAVSGALALPHGGSIRPLAEDAMQLSWPDGSTLEVQPVGSHSLQLVVHLPATRRARVAGLFGNFDGNAAGDLFTSTGNAVPDHPDFEPLYRTFADSWRVTQRQSLFDYGPGMTTENFTDRTFPDRAVTAADLPNRATAEAICRSAGVTDVRALADCALDVGSTGETAYARAAAAQHRTSEGADTTLLRVDRPGGQAQMTFAGTAGQRVYVDVPTSTAPDDCSPLELLDPSGALLNAGCITGGSGFIDATPLATTGMHTVVFAPDVAAQARVRVVTVTDQTVAVTGGSPVAVRIGQPGAVSDVTFNGIAGQRVSLDLANASLPDDCSPLSLRDDGGVLIAGGCIVGGRGDVDGVVLPRTGRYHFTIDPRGPATGTGNVTLRFG